MGDFIVSQIRTYVPIIVGALISWLVTTGILDAEAAVGAQEGLIISITAILQGLYYFVVRLLARKWPWFETLLGTKRQPSYSSLERKAA